MCTYNQSADSEWLSCDSEQSVFEADVLKAEEKGKHKDLSNFGKKQIVMAGWLSQSISSEVSTCWKNHGCPSVIDACGEGWLVHLVQPRRIAAEAQTAEKLWQAMINRCQNARLKYGQQTPDIKKNIKHFMTSKLKMPPETATVIWLLSPSTQTYAGLVSGQDDVCAEFDTKGACMSMIYDIRNTLEANPSLMIHWSGRSVICRFICNF